MKKCPICGETKIDTDFPKNYNYCRECNKRICKERYVKNRNERLEYSKKYFQDNKDKISNNQKDKVKELKKNVMEHYSNGTPHCAWEGCGITDTDMLTIDHINNDGAEHRRKINILGTSFYNWLIKNNYPDDFQVLCWNHQAKKRFLNPTYRSKTNTTIPEFEDIVFI